MFILFFGKSYVYIIAEFLKIRELSDKRIWNINTIFFHTLINQT